MSAARAHLLCLLMLSAITGIARAERWEDDTLSIDLPRGFDGPVAMTGRDNMEVIAFRWSRESPWLPTLLQITKYRNAAAESEHAGALERYLLRFLDGVARRRGEFAAGDILNLEIDGIPAARVAWEGLARGTTLSGVMYCVIAGSTVISFHTQDYAPIPRSLRQAIMNAIEDVEIASE